MSFVAPSPAMPAGVPLSMECVTCAMVVVAGRGIGRGRGGRPSPPLGWALRKAPVSAVRDAVATDTRVSPLGGLGSGALAPLPGNICTRVSPPLGGVQLGALAV